MPKKFIVEVQVPAGLKEGDVFKVEVEAPEHVKKPRGVLAGIAVPDMSDEQLKRELINANSVLYKAKQRGASQEIIDANQARVDAAKAERDKRGLNVQKPVATATVVVNDAAAATDEAAADGVYKEETATEI